MTDDERVVTSFVDGDETIVGTWAVTQASRSKGHLPPLYGEQVVAVTDERLLWFDDALVSVALDAIEAAEAEYVEQQAMPPIVLGGAVLLIVGLLASVGAFVMNLGDPLLVATPALTGLLAYHVSTIVARRTGREGEVRAGHRLRLWTADGPVSIWGDETPIAEIEAAIEAEPADADEAEAVDDAVDDEAEAVDDAVDDVGEAVDDLGDGGAGESTVEDAENPES